MNRQHVTIFEGCDGSGKTTAARRYAEVTGARYVHLGPYPRVGQGLARLYAEAMLPAVLGYQSVVLDRSWLSEQPYGFVFRDGADRIGTVNRRMLERLAMSCGALVIRCDPGPDVCVSTWLSRKGQEYLDKAQDVEAVNKHYRMNLHTELRTLDYDYTLQPTFYEPGVIDSFRPARHPIDSGSVGNWEAKVCLVGEAFGHVKDHDPLYQWPFASFSAQGCSQWVTAQLAQAGIREDQLLWVNADHVAPGSENNDHVEHLIALGGVASQALLDKNFAHHHVAHPMHAKRFNPHQPYELVTLLKELLA